MTSPSTAQSPAPDEGPALPTSPHRWVSRGSFGDTWWACECGAMSATDKHPDQGGKVARQGDGVHYAEVAFFPSPKYRMERVEDGYRLFSVDDNGAFS